MDKTKRMSINLIAQVISFLLNAAINFLLTPFIVTYISNEIYGFVGLANTFTGYITIITVALNTLHSRYVTINMSQKKYEKASMYFSSVTIANTVMALILVIPSAFFIVFLDRFLKLPDGFALDIKILWAFIFVSFLISLAAGSMDVAPYSCNRLDLSARRAMESNVLKCMILVIFFGLLAPHIWYVGASTLAASIYVVVTNLRYVKKLTPQLKIRRKLFRWSAVKELVSNGIWSSINQLTQVLMNGVDLLIANIAISAMDMSLLSYSKVIPLQLTNLMMTISNTFSPSLTMTYAGGDKQKFIDEVNSSMKICGFFCSIPVLGFAAFGEPFFRLWLPTLTDAQIQTVQILSLMTLLPLIFHAYLYPLCMVNVITCKIRIPGIFSLILGVLNVAGVVLLLNTTSLGLFAIKLVSMVLLIVKTAIFIPIYAAENISVKWYTFYLQVIRGGVASVLVLVLYLAIEHVVTIDSWIGLIVTAVLAGALGYVLNFLIVLNRKERRMVLDKLLKKRKKDEVDK